MDGIVGLAFVGSCSGQCDVCIHSITYPRFSSSFRLNNIFCIFSFSVSADRARVPATAHTSFQKRANEDLLDLLTYIYPRLLITAVAIFTLFGYLCVVIEYRRVSPTLSPLPSDSAMKYIAWYSAATRVAQVVVVCLVLVFIGMLRLGTLRRYDSSSGHRLIRPAETEAVPIHTPEVYHHRETDERIFTVSRSGCGWMVVVIGLK